MVDEEEEEEEVVVAEDFRKGVCPFHISTSTESYVVTPRQPRSLTTPLQMPTKVRSA